MGISSSIRRWILVAIAAAFAVQPVLSREKSDVIILKNGNNVTGEIWRLQRGLLTVKTDAMGTLDIKWEDVKHISSRFVFVVEGSRGERYIGALQAAAEDQRLNIVGRNPVSNLDHMSVVELSEVGSTLWNKFSGSIELGYTFTKASDRTQLNVNSDLTYRTKRYEGQFAYDTMISNSNGVQEANRKVISLGGSRYLGKKWQLLSKAMWEHNLELQLDKRFSFLGAPAYDILKTNRSSFLLVGGIAFSHETYYGQLARNNAEGNFGLNAQVFKLYSPKLDLTTSYYVLPNFTTSGRVRMELNSSLRFEIFKDFFVNFSFYDSYDNRPPSETATTNDYGIVTGVSWSFHR
jgi:hypothetical protein